MEEQFKYSFQKFNLLPEQQIQKQFFALYDEFYGTQKYEKLMYNCTHPNEKSMNRYNNILPYQDNVVKHKGQSYYNASEIRLLHGERIIATQAPVEPFEHFWRIVLEENVGLVMMLCALDDPKRGKQADKYWPDKGTIKQGSISVTVKQASQIGEKLTQRDFIVSDGVTQKLVTQLHWYGWKDFGVPTNESITIVEKLISQIHAHFDKKESIILHCSAGVGRTGTLIAIIDGIGLINRGDKELSVFEIVSNIRKQRFGSIQTEEQYAFVHKFLKRYIGIKQ